nr:reverse transcriptase domain-containing protein [Tanacetum cinerariifolium]
MSNNMNHNPGPPPVGPIPQNGPPGPNLQNPAIDIRPMDELLQVPTYGIGDAIVVHPVLACQFKLKIGLLNLVTAISFHGFENDDPHSHIRRVAQFIPQPITMTLSGLEEVKHFKLRKLKHLNQKVLIHQMLTDLKLPLKGAELFFEAGRFLLTLAGAEDGSFMVTPFKVLALNVEFDFKIDLIVFGPDTENPVVYSAGIGKSEVVPKS